MSITNAIINYRRSLKRRNYSKYTIRNYMSTIRQFVIWMDVPLEAVTHKKLLGFIDHLLARRLRPKTINCYLHSIRRFYEYLINEEEVVMDNPVKRGDALRMSRPLPRYLRDEQVAATAVDLRRRQLFIYQGKGGKDRLVYLSNDAYQALVNYLRVRPFSRNKKLFLVNKGRHRGKPFNVRGIQYRMQHYAKKAGLKVSCHQLRHTMATQMLNADADLVTIQDLLGHARIKTTEQYCRVSNQKVRRDYYSAMDKVLQRHSRTKKKILDNASRMRN
jgi:site-specific recombinase XerD